MTRKKLILGIIILIAAVLIIKEVVAYWPYFIVGAPPGVFGVNDTDSTNHSVGELAEGEGFSSPVPSPSEISVKTVNPTIIPTVTPTAATMVEASIYLESSDENLTIYVPVLLDENKNVLKMYDTPVINGKVMTSILDAEHGKALKISKSGQSNNNEIHFQEQDEKLKETQEQANACLENTKGFRLMGQRFIPDSYLFTNLVGEYTDIYQGDKQPFTLVIDGAGRPIRGFPRGLDVMALLGSNRSRELLDKMNDSRYKEYDHQYDKLKNEFDSFNNSEWNKNLYWSWLFALKPLFVDHGEGYPTFMQTPAWKDKELTTSLASWTELRHDTILYAKQSYGLVGSAYMPPEEKPASGYVEPVPEFYNRLLALTRMTNQGLGEMNVLDESEKSRLENLKNILSRLVEISSKELDNTELTRDEYDFIKNIGDSLNYFPADGDEKGRKTTMIADVHTDGNTGQVLEEGTGYVDLIVVAYKLPDGRIQVGAGRL